VLVGAGVYPYWNAITFTDPVVMVGVSSPKLPNDSANHPDWASMTGMAGSIFQGWGLNTTYNFRGNTTLKHLGFTKAVNGGFDIVMNTGTLLNVEMQDVAMGNSGGGFTANTTLSSLVLNDVRTYGLGSSAVYGSTGGGVGQTTINNLQCNKLYANYCLDSSVSTGVLNNVVANNVTVSNGGPFENGALARIDNAANFTVNGANITNYTSVATTTAPIIMNSSSTNVTFSGINDQSPSGTLVWTITAPGTLIENSDFVNDGITFTTGSNGSVLMDSTVGGTVTVVSAIPNIYSFGNTIGTWSDTGAQTVRFDASVLNINKGVTTNAPFLTGTQIANADDTLDLKRFTDTTPTGNFLNFFNAAGSTALFTLDVTGAIKTGIWNGTAVGYQYGGTGLTAAPATSGSALTMTTAGVSSWASEQSVVPGGVNIYGFLPVGTVISAIKTTNAGHFTALDCNNVNLQGGTCTTAPTVNVYDGATNIGTALTCSPTAQATRGTTTSNAQTLAFAAGDIIGIYISTAGSACGASAAASPLFSVMATITQP
jgi:hypothetical protein